MYSIFLQHIDTMDSLLTNSTQLMNNLAEILSITLKYECALLQIVFLDKKYAFLYSIFPDDRWARVHIYSQGLIFHMWNRPHYRAKSLQQDMKDNLRNVAIPGTGIPLSIFCYHWVLVLLFLCIANPLVCLCGAINKVLKERTSATVTSNNNNNKLAKYYTQHLLRPDDWFSFWRLNCQVVSYHSLVRQHSPGYRQEDKWTFLKEGKEAGVPVSPFLEMENIVCKNKNIEGGMGIHFFKVRKISIL